MKKLLLIYFLILACSPALMAQDENPPGFKWGNAVYLNLNIGEPVNFEGKELELLAVKKHLNQLRVNTDSVWVKVSKRTPPAVVSGVRVFVAGNKNEKIISGNSPCFNLIEGDALVCVSNIIHPMLDPKRYIFPVSFNDGFVWEMEEDSYLFSLLTDLESEPGIVYPNPGIDIDLHDARGLEKHWLLAIENSKVVWIKDKGIDAEEKEACVLLESESNPGIYYLYEHLYRRNLGVRVGQMVNRGEPVGTAWGDKNWGHLHFAVIKSDTIPQYENRFTNIVNFFPQLYELYHGRTFGFSKSYSKGRILFGQPPWINRNEKNLSEFEEYLGKGWIFDSWNCAEKVQSVTEGNRGNARFSKSMFTGTVVACTNPDDFYTYEISVPNGIYRIRAKVGDLLQPSWQQIVFEGVSAGKFNLDAGELVWTGEKAVKVTDRKLTVRIFVDKENQKVAGLSEIVFQRAN